MYGRALAGDNVRLPCCLTRVRCYFAPPPPHSRSPTRWSETSQQTGHLPKDRSLGPIITSHQTLDYTIHKVWESQSRTRAAFIVSLFSGSFLERMFPWLLAFPWLRTSPWLPLEFSVFCGLWPEEHPNDYLITWRICLLVLLSGIHYQVILLLRPHFISSSSLLTYKFPLGSGLSYFWFPFFRI